MQRKYPDTSNMNVTPHVWGDAERYFSGIAHTVVIGRGTPESHTKAIGDLGKGGLQVVDMLKDLQQWCGVIEQRLRELEARQSAQPKR